MFSEKMTGFDAAMVVGILLLSGHESCPFDVARDVFNKHGLEDTEFNNEVFEATTSWTSMLSKEGQMIIALAFPLMFSRNSYEKLIGFSRLNDIFTENQEGQWSEEEV